ncbi:MAG: pre-peptidase C-terminal domain-containing protein [Cyanophyceae cyanobacterium]
MKTDARAEEPIRTSSLSIAKKPTKSSKVVSVADAFEEPNDTITQAVTSGLNPTNPRTFEASSFIGNNPDVAPTEDVDFISFELGAGDRVAVDIDAQVLGSTLDSILRLFDSEGNQVAVNDDSDGFDSLIDFTAPAADTYFAGVSSFANSNYDPFAQGSGSDGLSTGEYDISIELISEDPGELENGSFDGTFGSWQTIGDTSIENADFGVTPTDGSFQALIANGVSDSGAAVTTSDLEEFLDLSPGLLDNLSNGDVTEGSAIKQAFVVNEGDVLTFDWNFLTNESTPEETFNDFAFFSVSSPTIKLADTTEPSLETLAVGFNEETGFRTAAVGFSESETVTLNLGVVDVEDNNVNSALIVDNIRISDNIDGGDSSDSEFDIDIVFTDDNLTDDQQAVFTDAANRWEEIIIGDVPDVIVPGFGLVDDISIDVSTPSIDGPGGVLGQAGPTVLRSDSFLPAQGIMEFDIADLELLEEEGLFEDVILHEMDHALGFGTIWQEQDLLIGVDSDNPQFVGAGATAEYNDIFGVNESSVPVESEFGPGTALSHWDEELFGSELMTGFINAGENPLSRITAASMGDLGYEVNVDAADPYAPPSLRVSSSKSVGRILAMNLEKTFVEPMVGRNIILDIEPEFV